MWLAAVGDVVDQPDLVDVLEQAEELLALARVMMVYLQFAGEPSPSVVRGIVRLQCQMVDELVSGLNAVLEVTS